MKGIRTFFILITILGVVIFCTGHFYLGIVITAVFYILQSVFGDDTPPPRYKLEQRNKKNNSSYNEKEHFVYWNLYNKRRR